MNENIRKERRQKCLLERTSGITLIALVVTIVVLLILAGITITMVFSDNGIIKMAQEAAEKTNKAVQDELEQLESINEWLQGNVTATGQKTPIKVGEQVVAVDIKIIVNGLEKGKTITTEEELAEDVNSMLKGKSTKEKEEMLERIMQYWIESGKELDYEPTIENFYEYLGVSSLEEVAIGMYGEEEGARAKMEELALDSLENLAILDVLRFAPSPYYEVGKDNEGNAYWKKQTYEIIPPDGLSSFGEDTYTATENGEYEFKVQVQETGREIPVKVIVDEIDSSISGENRNYEIISSKSKSCYGLKNKQTGEYTTFEEVYAIYKGKSFNVTSEIEENHTGDMFEQNGWNGNSYNYILESSVGNYIERETGENIEYGEECILIIKKEGKFYTTMMPILMLQ